jgi:hypothetical protein
MKHIMLLMALLFSFQPSLAKMSHDEIVKNMAMNKVGKAPQKGRAGPHPKYNKFKDVFPDGKKSKKIKKKKQLRKKYHLDLKTGGAK